MEKETGRVTQDVCREKRVVTCIKIHYRGSSCLLPVERIEAVSVFPVIVEVPEAPPEVIGLSSYGGTIIPYYHIVSDIEGQKECKQFRCGILLQTGDGLIGIVADEASEEQGVSAEDLKGQMPEQLIRLCGGYKV